MQGVPVICVCISHLSPLNELMFTLIWAVPEAAAPLWSKGIPEKAEKKITSQR
jgi:hypothetical protein